MTLDNAAAADERYGRFVRRVRESGLVGGLKSDQGWAVAPSNEDDGGEVMPFWSDRAYAAQCAKDEWAPYAATSIPLNQFLAQWLPGMAREGVKVGTNWNAHLVGREVAAIYLKDDLEAP